MAEPATEPTDASQTITTTTEPEFEDSETTISTADATSSPETFQTEFLRKPGGGFGGFIGKLHNHQLNKLDFLKNKFTTTSTISPPIIITPTVPVVTPTLPSYTIIKVVKFPCGPFLKCLLKKGEVATTIVPRITTSTTRRITTSTTPLTTTTTRMPITIVTPRNPVVTMGTTSTQAPIALETEEVAA